ncbi:hypothetical protein BC832DRAFT_116142 [Gaertneriomyces semiglobifer]|nr:hypothetical protein BC832DRAFT_116142 [Gaertneriomyces semiglobifer]
MASSQPNFTKMNSLELQENVQVPDLGDNDVLVKIHAASLNYRELAIASGMHDLPIKPNVVPGSDGAGTVVAVGAKVTIFKKGDKVCTHMTPHHDPSKLVGFLDISGGLGEMIDGTLRTVGVFHESALVPAPATLSFSEAATLTCSALTAWNALYGLKGREVKEGDWVLVQGTGGVSIAALQIAVAAGATVVATTSSERKAERLKLLGAAHVINYRADASWGETARLLTPGNQGFDNVIDVGGMSTLHQSLKAVKLDGLITATGLLGDCPDGMKPPLLLDALFNVCIVRGVLLGTKRMFIDMCKRIDEVHLKPAFDERAFAFTEVKDAYQYLKEQKHFGKVIVEVP